MSYGVDSLHFFNVFSAQQNYYLVFESKKSGFYSLLHSI